MDRRLFLRNLLGGTASAVVAPSLVWPFRKIFLPAIVTLFEGSWLQPISFLSRRPTIVDLKLTEMAVQAIELEAFAKEIPNYFYKSGRLYDYLKNGPVVGRRPAFRLPIRGTLYDLD
jgi:hypothetical protein